MQKISKGNEPPELTTWKRHNRKGNYKQLTPTEVRAIRQSCINEQQYLCAYCCGIIELDKSHNEHVKPKSKYLHLSLNYDNIVASCESQVHCGHKKDDEDIPLTPLMPACETELKFTYSGKVWGSTSRAEETINILNLNHPLAIRKRQQSIMILMITHYGIQGRHKRSLNNEDPTILEILKQDCQKATGGKLFAHAPILVNIINNTA